MRFTAPADPNRHKVAAAALGAEADEVRDGDAGDVLANRVAWFIRTLELPNGLGAVGYTEEDIPKLVEGTLPQHRVTKLSPIEAGTDELTRLFKESLQIW